MSTPETALILPPERKGCQHGWLPVPDENVTPLNTLVRCRCGRWFRHADTFSGNWSPLSSWVPVRWFNVLARRRIKRTLPPGQRP